MPTTYDRIAYERRKQRLGLKGYRGLIPCPSCGWSFDPDGSTKPFRRCSWCRSHRSPENATSIGFFACRDCGSLKCAVRMEAHPTRKRCDECRNRAAAARKKGVPRRRRSSKERRATIARLRERDGDKCSLCRARMDFTVPTFHPESVEIDHVLSIADGGGNDDPNLALAHRRCNLAKGKGKVAQLRLIA